MDSSTPGFPVLWEGHLPEMGTFPRVCSNSGPLSQWCHLTISSRVAPFPYCPQSFPAPGSVPMSVTCLASGGQSIGASASASASVLPMNIQDWFPLGWTGLICLQSNGLSRVFSNTTVQIINSSALNFLYGPTLTFIHNYWRNHSFDQMNLCWQNNVSAF